MPKKEPIKELERRCLLFPDDDKFGVECRELIRERTEKGIGDYTFVNKFFSAIDDIKDKNKKETLTKDLETYIKEKEVHLHQNVKPS